MIYIIQMNETDIAYNKLVSYPLPEYTISYRRREAGEPHAKTNFHDLVFLNMNELMPNIPLGLHQGKTCEEIQEWIEKTKIYNMSICNHFNNLLDRKSYLIHSLREQRKRQEVLSLEKVEQLPCDVLNYMYLYLDPETRFSLMKARYPTIKSDMTKWKVSEIKQFYKDIVLDKYVNKINEDYTRRCLGTLDFKGISMTNKDAFIKETFKVIDTLNNASPRHIKNCLKFKKRAFKLLSSVIYSNNKLTEIRANKKSKK